MLLSLLRVFFFLLLERRVRREVTSPCVALIVTPLTGRSCTSAGLKRHRWRDLLVFPLLLLLLFLAECKIKWFLVSTFEGKKKKKKAKCKTSAHTHGLLTSGSHQELTALEKVLKNSCFFSLFFFFGLFFTKDASNLTLVAAVCVCFP